MLKHSGQISKSTKPNNDGQDSTCNQNPTSFENAAFSDNDTSLCDTKDFEVRSGRRSNLSLTDNSVHTRGLSVNNNNTLNDIREEFEEDPASNRQNTYKKAIVIVITLMITVLGVCSAVGYHYIGYYPETKILNYGDTKIIEYSPNFCSAVTSDSEDVWLSVVSSVDYIGQARYTMFTLVYLEVGQTWSRMFHLSKKSMVSINISSKDIIFVLVFKGKHRYDLWLGRKTTVSYEMKQACCLNGKLIQRNRIEFSSNEDEDYYFVLYRDESFGSPVYFNATLEFIRPKIDSTRIKQQCKTSIYSKCSVSLTFRSNEKAIIELYNRVEIGVITKETNIGWKCDARIWFYCIVFGIAIIILSALFVFSYIIMQRYYKSKHSKSMHEEKAVHRQTREAVCSNDHSTLTSIPAGARKSLPRRSYSPKVLSESIEKFDNWAVDYDTCNRESIEPKPYQNINSTVSRNNKETILESNTGGIATIFRKESETGRNGYNRPLGKYKKRTSKAHGYSGETQSNEFELRSLTKDDFDEITIDLPREKQAADEAGGCDMVDRNFKKGYQQRLKVADGSRTTVESTKTTRGTRFSQTVASASSSNGLNRHKKSNNLLTESLENCLEVLSVEHLDQKSQFEGAYKQQPEKSKNNEIKLIGKPIDI